MAIRPRNSHGLRRIANPPKKSEDGALTQKIKAGVAANLIFWTAIVFYVPQLGLWVIGIASLGLNSVPVLGYAIPGQEIYMVSWFIIFLIGMCTMLYAVFIFIMRGIKCFEGWLGLIFIICLTGYMVVFINFIPFFLIWIFSVVLLQKGE